MNKTNLSIVIPAYNEEQNVSLLYEEIKPLFSEYPSVEVIFVDDGSRDLTLTKMRELAEKDPHVKVISFGRNYGQTAAMGVGVKFAIGDVIVPLDADLQNDPRDIPILVSKLEEGYDVVSGWRKDRHDEFFRVLLSQYANKIIAFITGVKLNDYGCTLKAYRAQILKNIDFFGEIHRLIPAYASWQGARVTEVVVNHRARKYGSSKYGFSRIGKLLLDLLVVKYFISYSQKPIYFFGWLGAVSFGLGFLSFIVSVALRLFAHISLIQTPLLLLTVFLFVVGVQLISMGLFADMILRTRADKQSSLYPIKELIGL